VVKSVYNVLILDKTSFPPSETIALLITSLASRTIVGWEFATLINKNGNKARMEMINLFIRKLFKILK
jgi:hypothetical protein